MSDSAKTETVALHLAVTSKHLNSIQLRGLNAVGLVYAPGLPSTAGSVQVGLPSFIEARAMEDVDVLLDPMHPQDLSDLKILLYLLGLLPPFMVRGFVEFVERWPRTPTLRLIRLGLRGLALSLYSSRTQVHHAIGFAVHVATEDQDGR